MSIVIITIRDEGDDELNVSAEFEPIILARTDFSEMPFTHQVGIGMMQYASTLNGASEVTANGA